METHERCELCFGRGYRGASHKYTRCKRCDGTGRVLIGSYNRNPWGWDEKRQCTTYNGIPVTGGRG
jgi:DnaJ-class molecular chaperone